MKKYIVDLRTGKTKLEDVTQVDQDNIAAEKAASLAEKPMRDWMAQMASTDAGMPRYVEDIIDALEDHIREAINPETIDKYTAKKTLRLEKPT